MTELDRWLKQATRHLSRDSAAQVRTEIQEHYESAREAAISGGATADEAGRLALTALGDAEAANRQYRKVLLTSAEARMLREFNLESQFVCSRLLVKGLLLATSAGALLAAVAFFGTGATGAARVLLVVGIVLGVLFDAPVLLPIYTRSRARVYRCVKWIAVIGTLVFAFGPNALEYSWLLMSCLWPLVWIEWTRASIRRKLPVAQWPKQLYL